MDFRLIDSGWDSVLNDALRSRHPKLRIICPFIKRGIAHRLLELGKPKAIQVITRFDLRDFYAGVSDTSALRLLLEKGAKIRGVRNLHAKVYLFGEHRSIVTSANLTSSALGRNHEFGFVSDDSSIIGRCGEYFDNLWGRAGLDLSRDRLDAWDEMLNAEMAKGGRSHRPPGLKDEGVDAGMRSIPIELPPWAAEAPQSFVKIFGLSHKREKRSTLVMVEVERAGSHWACTYPINKRPRGVNDGALMFMGLLVGEPNDIIIFGRAIGMKHVEGRDDASAADIRRREFKARWPNYIRVHHAEFIAGTIGNGVSLNELMDKLGGKAFMATQRNAVSGEGNTDPRKAYRQQAQVELSPDGHEWVSSRLENVFQVHGKVPACDLERLDRPELQADSSRSG
jgi:hypothetical protein